jgi:hypothetical protein
MTCLKNLIDSLLSWVLVKKREVVYPLKKFIALYGHRRLIATFTGTHRRPLSWAR